MRTNARKIRLALTALMLVALLGMVFVTMPANAQLGTPTQLTTDTRYDRNPSFFRANDGTYWLFFVRNVDNDPKYPDACEGHGCDAPGCNCDAAQYEIYYMTSVDNGATWSAPAMVPNSSPPTGGHRGMAAFQDNTGKIWVFVSGPTGDGKINYYTFDGTTWTGPTLVTNVANPGGFTGSHVDAFQAQDGKIWVFYQDGAAGVKAIYYDGAAWSNPIVVSATANDGIPKAIQDSTGKFHCVMANWAAGGAYHYATSDDNGLTWTAQPDPVTVPGTTSCDPVLYEDAAGKLWLFYAPWDGTTNSQWIEVVTSTDGGATWSGRVRVTSGGYTGSYWWDMWPEPFQEADGDMLLFYTSEKGTRIDGNIWITDLDGLSVEESKSEKTDADPDTVSNPAADTDVIKRGTGNPTVTISKYATNPGGAPTFAAIGKYIDVMIDDSTNVTEIEIRLYYTDAEVAGLIEESLRLYWWNGTAWVQCSDSGVNTAANYIWAKIRADTTPNLNDLVGAPFGGGGERVPIPVGGVIVPVSKIELLAPWLGLAALMAAMIAAVVVRRRRGA